MCAVTGERWAGWGRESGAARGPEGMGHWARGGLGGVGDWGRRGSGGRMGRLESLEGDWRLGGRRAGGSGEEAWSCGAGASGTHRSPTRRRAPAWKPVSLCSTPGPGEGGAARLPRHQEGPRSPPPRARAVAGRRGRSLGAGAGRGLAAAAPAPLGRVRGLPARSALSARSSSRDPELCPGGCGWGPRAGASLTRRLPPPAPSRPPPPGSSPRCCWGLGGLRCQ